MTNNYLTITGNVTFRGFCRSANDTEKKNRLTLKLSERHLKRVRDTLKPIYYEKKVPDVFIPKFIKDENIDIVSLNSKYQLEFSEYNESIDGFITLEDADIYTINEGALISVAIKIIPAEGRVGLYPKCIRILKNGEKFDADIDWKKEMKEAFN